MAQLKVSWGDVTLSGTADNQTADVGVIIIDVGDEAEAIAAALALSPTTFFGIPKTDMATASRVSQRIWNAKIKYSTKVADQKRESREAAVGTEPEEGVNYEIDFECTGSTIRIVKSRRTKYVAMTSEPFNGETDLPVQVDFDRNINDNGNEVAGVEFPPPADFSWAETHYISRDSVNQGYINKLQSMLNLVNKETFRGRPPGCVLFRGLTGKRKDTRSYALTFKFEAMEPKVKAKYPDTGNNDDAVFYGINADGYDVVWVKYEKDKSKTGDRMIQKAVQLQVEEVVKRVDFKDLGIGVAGLRA